MKSQLIINSLGFKRWTSLKFTCFLQKSRFLCFFRRPTPNRGKISKNSPLEPRQASSAKIGYVGVYFAKTGGKIEDGFADIFGEYKLSSYVLFGVGIGVVFCAMVA